MKVKISEKIICIPPYISTTWDQISFVQSARNETTARFTLFLHLREGNIVAIPDLDASIIDIAFSAHMQHLERSQTVAGKDLQQKAPMISSMGGEQLNAFPIRLAFAPGMEGIEGAFAHNPAQAGTPPLPKELLEKISAITKILTNGDMSGFPKPEPHCNCMHCQVARSLHNLEQVGGAPEEESVTEEDLRFRSWEIAQSGEKLYQVINPIDRREQYSVYLGTPVGCTCGQAHCEHIKAVLSS